MTKRETSEIISYYHHRAKEYDELYLRAERQEDLSQAAEILKKIFAGKNVLEIACGTGYWTNIIAETAESILAVDINETMIDLARHKTAGKLNVNYFLSDFYRLKPEGRFDALFGGFIWSHIPLQELDNFLLKVTSLLNPGGIIVFIDNIFVEGNSTPIAYTDEYDNTYQKRELKNQPSSFIIKNFPSESFLREKIVAISTDTEYIQLKYYWILRLIMTT